MARDTILLIDAHALIHRAFHALPPLSAPDGRPTGALYGLSRILLKVLREREFAGIYAAFDRPEPTHRKDSFADYKAHRPKAPDELVSQLIEARELFRTFGIPVVEMSKVEADDIIGTLATQFARDGREVTILTGDLDALQLVKDPYVRVETFKKGVSETMVYDERAVKERYGFGPEYIPDLKGIMGDASDNIKGVPGVGEGSALKLVRSFGSIEGIYRALAKDGVEECAKRAGIQARFIKLMVAHETEARFSKKLATIDTAVPLDVPHETFRGIPENEVNAYFSQLGFESLRARPEGLSHMPSPRADVPADDTVPKDSIFIEDAEDALLHLKDFRGKKEKVAYDWKTILKNLGDKAGMITGPFFDLLIAGWLIDPDQQDFSKEALIARFVRSGAQDDRALYLALRNALTTNGLMGVFEKIEMPLVPVLALMERTGIAVDRAHLRSLSQEMRKELAALEERITREAGGAFNINSPRQVAEVLFERLNLGTEKKRKTRTGQRRTGRDILLELKSAHPIVPLLLEYRETFKIFSSFVEPLLAAIEKDGRVRTTFLQTGTATGRLASERPNLQNIPQESKWAKLLRCAFTAPRGTTLVSFDYSQLELRLLAHVSEDEALRTAFREGKDIHALTAAKVFHVPLSGVTPPMRRTAKTLNFGIVYGMGARAFAASSGLSLADAKRFMEEYFNEFPSVRRWQERVKKDAKANGYVANEHGRRRWFREASKRGSWGEVERAAINMPLQSLGADILKLSMAGIADLISTTRDIRMVLSVHDELLFEMPRGMLHTQAPAIQKLMESVVDLSVPLRVDIRTGDDWGSMEPWQDAA